MPDPQAPLGRFDLPFQEQIDFFRQKLSLPTAKWDDIWQSAHDRSFVVAGAMKADLLADLSRAVLQGIEQGTTLESFREDFRQIVFNRGWHGWTGEGSEAGFNWRTKVIYETNMRSSYAAGREAQLADPGLQQLLPYRRYIHNDSVLHPRPQHLAWNGLTLPHDHPFWKTHSPPNGWGCRCRVTAVAAPKPGDATELPAGWDAIDEKTGAPVGIDKGWGYAPGASVADELRALVEQKAGKLPAPVAADFKAEMAPVIAGSTDAKTGAKVRLNDNAGVNEIKRAASFLEAALIDRRTKQPPLILGPVSASIETALETLGAKPGRRSYALDHDYTIHIHDSHGLEKERQRGQIPITAEDIAKIGQLVESSSVLDPGDPTHSRNGAMRVAVAVIDGGYRYGIALEVRKRTLVPCTIFKRLHK